MARTRDVAFIRKLCGLGVPAQALVPSLLPALRGLIPSHSAGVFWVDERGEMSGLYAERMLPPEAMDVYDKQHYQKARDGFAPAFRARAADKDPVSCRSFTRAEQETEYFQDVMRPLDAYHVMYGILHNGTRPFAQISFYRGRSDRPFDRDNCETLRGLLRYVASGLAQAPSLRDSQDPSVMVEEHLGIVTAQGSILSAPEGWHRLLRLAALSEVSPRQALRENALVEDFLRRICAEAVDQRGTTAPCSADVDSAWGRFSVRAFRLPDAKGRRADQFGLLIRREEPQSLSLVRGTAISELSAQQREVALLLARGMSNREIAEELGLSFNTASYHVKQVFVRLDVNDRDEVASKLLRLAQLAGAHRPKPGRGPPTAI
jgi:DNA-binding CsgD family transcriptional regulator